jgi:hypothetical protein
MKENDPRQRKGKAGDKEDAREARERRLAEALRANLKRRKAAAQSADAPIAEPPPRPPEADLE